jgi:hypothetical protein
MMTTTMMTMTTMMMTMTTMTMMTTMIEDYVIVRLRKEAD